MVVQPAAEPARSEDSARSPGAPPAAVRLRERDDFDRDVWCVLGLPVDNLDLPRAVTLVETAARDRRRLSFVTPNVNWLVRALRDREARREILEADLSLADGAPLVLMARMLGTPIRARAAGSDLFEALRLRPGFVGRRIRVFFFGGRDGAAEAASAALARDRGGLEAAGWLNPGYGDVASMSSEETIGQINAAAPDFLVVALGGAKGQRWIAENQSRIEAPVIAHLGAVVDFTAGRIRRAPRLAARLGLEWLWRIAAEPALWSRYVKDGAALALIAARRLAPQLGLARRGKARMAGSAVFEPSGRGALIRLSGDLVDGALDPVRAAFRQAAAAGRPVTLDFSAVGGCDRAFLGLILMLEKHLPAGGETLSLRGVCPSQLRLLRANAMAYPTLARAVEDAPARERLGAAGV